MGKHSRYLANEYGHGCGYVWSGEHTREASTHLHTPHKETHTYPLLSPLDDARTRSALVVRRYLPHKQGQRNAFRVIGSFGFSGSVGRTAYARALSELC